ncbi:MAG TPA: alkaline phosphatase family protein [Terriglobia bacterium]|nr:alkaline phosphatase family protein [Terriglobia bacterium]
MKARVANFWLIALLLLVAAAFLSGCSHPMNGSQNHKVIVLGIDGMDPQLLHRYVQDGRMPNFQRLEREGSFHELGTSIPPQSPVAWSNVITGMNPGGHGIFDFIHRDPDTMQPRFSIASVEAPRHVLNLGNWSLPLSSGKATLLRHGKAFWQILDEHNVPATVVHMPVNFPPVESRERTLAGMGTPDMEGTYGVFSFYTSDPLEEPGDRSGGRVYEVEPQDNRISAKLFGPPNTFKKGAPLASVDFTVWIDPNQPVAKISIGDQEIILHVGEWSDWVQVKFPLVPLLQSSTGICRIYLKQVNPYFKLYVSPINIDPSQPPLPLSTPPNYAIDLWKQVGFYYTQGIAEDTKALSAHVLDDGEYLEQARIVLSEQMKFFDLELARFHDGLLFVYFSSLDLNGHMMWRAFDPVHPAYDPDVAAKYGGVLEDMYAQMDQMLGKALAKLDGNTTLIVLSDHGFAPFERSFNLDTWLLQNGYIVLKPDANRGNKPGDLFSDVDWTRTRAYGLGLNGLYLNLSGRERYGAVAPGATAEALINEIRGKLLAVRDPATGLAPVTRIDKAEDVYSGAYVASAPDMLVGYNRTYRAGWETVLGQFTSDIISPNIEPWSGDHCIDYTLVPGVLLSNKRIGLPSPALTDIAPTILSEFGIATPKEMVGQSVFRTTQLTRQGK